MLMCPWPVGQQTNGKAPKSSELLLFSDVVIQVRPRMLSKQLKFVAMLWIRSSTSLCLASRCYCFCVQLGVVTDPILFLLAVK